MRQNVNLSDSSVIVWESAAESHAGNVRTENQDAVLDRPDLGIWVVADGMGGHSAGAAASRMVVEHLDSLGESSDVDSQVSAAVTRLKAANEQLIKHAELNGQGISGSTVAAFLKHDDRGAALWVGDSRVYRFRQGRLEQLTRDHSQLEEMIALGLVKREESRGHPSSNVLTRAIGAAPSLDPGVEFFSILPGDSFLICSDGLYNEIDEQEIAETLTHGSCVDSARSLLQRTLETGARDNVSLIVARAVIDDGEKTLVNPILSSGPGRD